MTDITKLRMLQEQIHNAMNELYQEVSETISNTPAMDGVEPNGRSCIVKLSTLKSDPSLCMDPGYYIPQVQQEAVEEVLLKKDLTLDVFTSRLDRLLKEKKAGNVRLNPNTLETLISVREAIG